jgi:hypothetical protein
VEFFFFVSAREKNEKGPGIFGRFWTPHREGLLPHTVLFSHFSIHFLVALPLYLLRTTTPLFCPEKIIFTPLEQSGHSPFCSTGKSQFRVFLVKSREYSSMTKQKAVNSLRKPHNVNPLPHTSYSYQPSLIRSTQSQPQTQTLAPHISFS